MDSLQFQKVELADARPNCVACKTPIENSYFQVNARTICPNCAERIRAGQQRPDNSAVMKGVVYGLGAAVACSIGYAILTSALHAEFALATIGVGYAVGRAIRTGSQGLGGLRCQIAAVVLTYLSITVGYVALVVHDNPGSLSPIGILIAAISYPFLALSDGAGGILTILIIFFGLVQAWRQTKRRQLTLMGPYTLKEGIVS